MSYKEHGSIKSYTDNIVFSTHPLYLHLNTDMGFLGRLTSEALSKCYFECRIRLANLSQFLLRILFKVHFLLLLFNLITCRPNTSGLFIIRFI